MAGLIQDNRAVKVYTPLPDNTLLFSSMTGSERISTLFDYRLELITENVEVDLDNILGKDITVQLDYTPSDYVSPGSSRYFHGIVASCGLISSTDSFMHYEFSVRPWLWFLTRTADCRIFQETSVPDIIEQVLSESGFSDYEVNLSGSYETWRYCVQYRETDYNFLSRLMEQEGIYYYFKHENGKHTLMIVDGYGGHTTLPGYAEVPYFPVGGNLIRERDHIQQWQLSKQLQPGKFATKDFNFEIPKTNMLAQKPMAGSHAKANYEIYDYPGEYPSSTGEPKVGNGETVAKIRMEELAVQHEIASGSGNAEGLSAGYLFKLTNCEIGSQNREYLILESQCSFSLDDYRSNSSGEMNFHNNISAISSKQQFRAPRMTPKPMVQGPQTAVVVGPSGEEIWTDKYGRVKLQFHWDRYGKSDENSSCWVRVSQVWAGQGWGSIHIPRIGHEVIVEFLEGDPDRPIITGRVYNGDNGVPYDLPANQTQSGIKSRSSKKGATANFNEIRMEDKKGDEELYIHAEKDMNVVVENDKTLKIGFDKKDKGDYTVDVKNDRTATVDSGNDTLLVKKGNRYTTVSSGDFITVVSRGDKDTTVKKGDQNTEVSKGDQNVEVSKGNQTTKIGQGDQKTEVSLGNHSLKVSAGSSKIEAMQKITLKVGSNSIEISQSGITIKGLMVKIDGEMTAEMKGGLTAKVEGGLQAEVKGGAMAKVQGGITMIN